MLGSYFGIFGGRIESGAATTGCLIDEVRVGQALRDVWWTKCEWGRHFWIFGGRIESGAGSSGFFVDEVRVGKSLQNFC